MKENSEKRIVGAGFSTGSLNRILKESFILYIMMIFIKSVFYILSREKNTAFLLIPFSPSFVMVLNSLFFIGGICAVGGSIYWVIVLVFSMMSQMEGNRKWKLTLLWMENIISAFLLISNKI